MKFRTDFVTNSSSSSFILSFSDRCNDDLTIEDAYQLIYQMFVKHYETVMSVINYIKSDSNSRMTFDEDGYLRYKNGKYEWNDDDNKKYWNKLKKKFGNDFDDFDINENKVSWVPLCPTYEDYLKYWTEKVYCENYSPSINAPFDICDYRAETMDVLHYRRCDYDLDTDEHIYFDTPTVPVDKSYENDELGWYFYHIDKYLEDENFKPEKYWDDEENIDWDKIREIRRRTEDNGLFIERVLNGRFAILSECGYIPDCIVDQLRGECEYSCNHMG